MVVEACTADAILDSSFTEIAPLYFKIVFYYMRLCDVLQVLNPKNAKSAPADWQTPDKTQEWLRALTTRTITVLSTRLINSSRTKLMLTIVKII